MVRPLVLATLTLFLSGCHTVLKLYVDPTLPKFAYADLKSDRQHGSLGLLVEWQTNGEPNQAATASARDNIIEVLQEARLFSTVSRGEIGTDMRLDFVINNAGGEGSKAGAVVTGLTFGAIGTGTIDRYYITATLHRPGHDPVVVDLEHALHGTIGAKRGPRGLKPMEVGEAVYQMEKEIVLYVLHELMAKGVL